MYNNGRAEYYHKLTWVYTQEPEVLKGYMVAEVIARVCMYVRKPEHLKGYVGAHTILYIICNGLYGYVCARFWFL